MLFFEASFPEIKIDVKGYTKTLDRTMGQIIREAAREWLRAILVSVPSRGGFPVYTGAAKSTLVPLGRVLRVAVPVSPVAKTDGRSRGESSQQFSIESKNFEYSFSWSTDLLHYYINEFYGVIPSAPWNTLEAGEAAFVSYVNDALKRRLPDIGAYIRYETNKTGG